MPTSDSHDYDLIDRLAEEFAKRIRDGERPSIQEYCDKYPHVAADLREMLPALAEVEQVKDEVQAPPAVEPPRLRQIGDYHILREVGRGGMGVVYEADDTRLGRRVALKVLATGKAGHALERFKREARAAARLHHTNIVPVFGVGDHDGLPYYVMQFIQGLGLDEVLDEVKRLQAKSGAAVPPSAVSARPRKDVSAAAVARSLVTGTFEPPANAEAAETLTHAGNVGQASRLPLSAGQASRLPYDPATSSSISLPGQSNLSGRKLTYWQSVAQIGLQVADALDYAHKQGILHRDIKPSNLLLDLHGVVWVTDFGLAKAADQEDLTHTGDVLGTLRYMPPEAFEGKSEARSDVYALGLSLYELLALRPAYDERNKEQLIKQATTTDPPRLGGLNRAIPRDLVTIVHKAIEKDRGHRYKSAAELAADLRRFLADQTILARRVSPGERFARWCRRNPTVAGLAAAVLVLLVAIAVVSAAMAIRVEGKADEARFEANRANEEADRANAALASEGRERRRTQALLSEQFVARGARLQQDGDLGGAALCYAEALRLDQDDPDRAQAHRVRLAAALREAPRPRHVFFHDRQVLAVAYSPDGKTLAAGCEDGTVRLWDVTTGNPVGDPLAHAGPVRQVSFAADGKRLWAACDRPDAKSIESPGGGPIFQDPPTALRLWDLETRRPVVDGTQWLGLGQAVLPDPTTNPRGGTLVAFMPKKNVLELRDGATGRPVAPPIETKDPIYDYRASVAAGRVVVFNYTDQEPASDLNGTSRLWDSTSGQPVSPPLPFGQVGSFAGSGDRFYLIFDNTGTVQWYESATGAAGPKFAAPGGAVFGVDVGTDGRRVVIQYWVWAADTGKLHWNATLVDADTGRTVGHPFQTTSRNFLSVVPSPDCSRLVVSTRDQVQLLSADGGQIAGQPVPPGSAVQATFSPDGGHVLLTAGDNTARVLETRTGGPVTPLLPHTGPIRLQQFSPDGSQAVLVSGSTVWVWPLARAEAGPDVLAADPNAGSWIRTEQTDTQGRRVGPIRVARVGRPRLLSADGRRVLDLPGSLQGTGLSGARLLDAATGTVLAEPPSAPVDALRTLGTPDFRPDGRAVLLRPIQTGDVLVPKEPGPLGPLTWLWDCDGNRIAPLANPPAGTVAAAFAFSPESRFVRLRATVGDTATVLRLFDATGGEALGPGVTVTAPAAKPPAAGEPGFNREQAREVAWSPDSGFVAVGDPTATGFRVTLFDARTGAAVGGTGMALEGGASLELTFSRDGRRLLGVAHGGAGPAADGRPTLAGARARVWEVPTGEPASSVLDGARFAGLGGELSRAVIDPAGGRLALVARPRSAGSAVVPDGDAAETVQVWDLAGDRPAGEPLVHDRPVGDVAFHPAGDRLLTVIAAGPVRIWRADTGELLHVLSTPSGFTTARFSADGRRVIAFAPGDAEPEFGGPASGQRCQVWDTATGQPLTPLLRPYNPNPFSGLAIAPEPTAVSSAADRLLVARADGSAALYILDADPRPADELAALARLLSGRQITTTGLIQGLGSNGYRAAWEGGRGRFAADWGGTPVEGLDWHRRQLEAGDPPPAVQFGPYRTRPPLRADGAGTRVWHLDRLIAADPTDPEPYVRRGEAWAALAEWGRAEADYTRVLALAPAGGRREFVRQQRAAARTERGQWDEAEADLRDCLKRAPKPADGAGPDPVAARAGLALLRLRRGDEAGYRAECRQLVELGRPAEVPGDTFRCWPALLLDGAFPGLAEVPLDKAAGVSVTDDVPFNLTAAAQYRQGKWKVAEASLAAVPTTTRPAADWYLLALAQHRLGKPEARASLAAGAARQKEGPAPVPFAPVRVPAWQSDLANDVLRREAEGLILGKK